MWICSGNGGGSGGGGGGYGRRSRIRKVVLDDPISLMRFVYVSIEVMPSRSYKLRCLALRCVAEKPAAAAPAWLASRRRTARKLVMRSCARARMRPCATPPGQQNSVARVGCVNISGVISSQLCRLAVSDHVPQES